MRSYKKLLYFSLSIFFLCANTSFAIVYSNVRAPNNNFLPAVKAYADSFCKYKGQTLGSASFTTKTVALPVGYNLMGYKVGCAADPTLPDWKYCDYGTGVKSDSVLLNVTCNPNPVVAPKTTTTTTTTTAPKTTTTTTPTTTTAPTTTTTTPAPTSTPAPTPSSTNTSTTNTNTTDTTLPTTTTTNTPPTTTTETTNSNTTTPTETTSTQTNTTPASTEITTKSTQTTLQSVPDTSVQNSANTNTISTDTTVNTPTVTTVTTDSSTDSNSVDNSQYNSTQDSSTNTDTAESATIDNSFSVDPWDDPLYTNGNLEGLVEFGETGTTNTTTTEESSDPNSTEQVLIDENTGLPIESNTSEETTTQTKSSIGDPITGITAEPIVSDIESSTFLLWGKNSSKYARGENSEFVIVTTKNTVGLTHSIYRRKYNSTDTKWRKVFTGFQNAYQNPSLVVDDANNLHILYSGKGSGEIEHYILKNIDSRILVNPIKVNTKILGNRNFYISISQYANSIFLCNSKVDNGVLICSVYNNNKWNKPQLVINQKGFKYLYTNILPLSNTGYAVSGTAIPNPNNTDVQSTQTVTAMFGKENNGLVYVSKYNKTLASYKDAKEGYEQGIDEDENNIYVLFAKGTDEGENMLYIINKSSGDVTENQVPNSYGVCCSIKTFNNKVYVFDAGFVNISSDAGQTWEKKDYEIDNYKKASFEYGESLILKSSNGKNTDGIYVLQEIIDKSTDKKILTSFKFE